jgi:hypothetical protein
MLCHASQLTWYRRLYMLFSRYTGSSLYHRLNSAILVDPESGSWHKAEERRG